MPGRLIEIIIPSVHSDRVRKIVQEAQLTWTWEEPRDEMTTFKLLVQTDEVEGLVDAIEPILNLSDHAQLLVLPVEAYSPRRVKDDQHVDDKKQSNQGRISRNELYEDLNEYANTTSMFLAMTVLASIIAAVGLSRNSPALIIGAMVIAPLLGPNMALGLATVLGDTQLMTRALKTNVYGVLTATGVGLVSGLILPLDPVANEILSRTNSSLGEIIIALATGVAGALAVSAGVASSLVGVMVSVALLPPVIIASMLIVQGSTNDALGAVLLVSINVVCLNLASVLTFYLKGIKPYTWWEAKRAKQSTRIAMMIWFGLLILMIALVTLSQYSN